ncbi:MAG: hypothetical protein KDD44_09020 [Bdellovibrionales bacterium]|nr:hypothetical protein [Bdellovibrionales bacterium]
MELTNVSQSEIVTALQATENTGVSDAKTTESPSDAAEGSSSDFASLITKALSRDMGAQVNEEELFAAIVEQKLAAHSDEAASYFREKKAQFTSEMMRSDGIVPLEAVVNKALAATEEAGHIDAETARMVKANSFAAAQLDDNLDLLWDGRGSAEDPSIAVATVEEAMAKMKLTLESIENGELDPLAEIPSAEVAGGASGPQQLDGDGGFLWKPVSESDGNLVVLLPTEFRDMISRVELHSSLPPDASTLLDEGRFTGDEDNGQRLHYRFGKPGGDYGDSVHVVAYTNDGSTLTWDIPNPAERQD